MAGFSTLTNEHLIRSNIWTGRVKENFEDMLYHTKWVDMITDFPDGDTINIPSLGQMEVLNYAEGQAVRYTAFDTGNFTFTINKYKSSATYITDKMKQDSFYMSRLVSSFVPKQSRALAKVMEVDALAVGNAAQTASDPNNINGFPHRWVARGASQIMVPQDFARANLVLDMVNVPATNRVAIVHPTVGYALETMTNLVNLSNNPAWEGIVQSGLVTGMRFVKQIYGIDVYTSQNLPLLTAGETVSGTAVNTTGVVNYIFSATPDSLPWIGAVRQAPRVESERNKDLQRDEFVTTSRYDFKCYRPESQVCILTATDQT